MIENAKVSDKPTSPAEAEEELEEADATEMVAARIETVEPRNSRRIESQRSMALS